MSDLIAVILASGRGSRFGGPKGSASLGDGTFLERILRSLQKAGIISVHVAEGLDTPDMLATLRQAVDGISSDQLKGYLVWPVDHPLVEPETLRVLLKAFADHPTAVLRPAHNGRPGHPVIIPAGLDLAGDDAGRGLAGVIRGQACTIVDVPVADPGIQRNLNRPEDLEE